MNNSETIYPPAVEQLLTIIVESSKELKSEDYPLYDECVREAYGPALFDIWMTGEELVLDQETFLNLLNLAAANSTVQALEEKGLIDCIADSDGVEHVFVTSKGNDTLDIVNNITKSINWN